VQNQQAAEVAGSVNWKKPESKRRDLDSRIYKINLNQSLAVAINSIERQYKLKVWDNQIATANLLLANDRKAQLI